MGEGNITKPYPPKDEWSPVPPYYDGLFAKVCARTSSDERPERFEPPRA
jgi:hypothetical protein